MRSEPYVVRGRDHDVGDHGGLQAATIRSASTVFGTSQNLEALVKQPNVVPALSS